MNVPPARRSAPPRLKATAIGLTACVAMSVHASSLAVGAHDAPAMPAPVATLALGATASRIASLDRPRRPAHPPPYVPERCRHLPSSVERDICAAANATVATYSSRRLTL